MIHDDDEIWRMFIIVERPKTKERHGMELNFNIPLKHQGKIHNTVYKILNERASEIWKDKFKKEMDYD